MCYEQALRYRRCGCYWGEHKFSCELQNPFSRLCRRWVYDVGWIDGYCAMHEDEILEIGGDDWDYDAGADRSVEKI